MRLGSFSTAVLTDVIVPENGSGGVFKSEERAKKEEEEDEEKDKEKDVEERMRG